jgi:hypothetical protein
MGEPVMEPAAPIIHVVIFRYDSNATPEEMKEVRILHHGSTVITMKVPVLIRLLLSLGLRPLRESGLQLHPPNDGKPLSHGPERPRGGRLSRWVAGMICHLFIWSNKLFRFMYVG